MKLPDYIEGLVKAQNEPDSKAFAAYFTEQTTVFDEGSSYSGRNEIEQWIQQATEKYKMQLKTRNTDAANYKVRIEAGSMDAIIYVLMHEATHIVDAVMDINPHPSEKLAVVPPTPFTKNIWRLMNKPDNQYLDSLLEKTRFRSGQLLPVSVAPEVYQKLAQTPFASLYAMAAWFEDIAELATIYHLTAKLNQPSFVVVTTNEKELSRFEPMKRAG